MNTVTAADGIARRARRETRWCGAAVTAAVLLFVVSAVAASADLRIALRWNTARLSAHMAPAMQAETSAIWTALGVTIVWDACPPDCAVGGGLLLVVADGLVDAAPTGYARLGQVTFVEGRPGGRLYVSAAAALDAIEQAAEKGGPFATLPTAARHDAAVRLMGRAAAHELGHYLLGSAEHASRGLMRRAFTADEGLARGPGPYGLDGPLRDRLRSRLDVLSQAEAGPPTTPPPGAIIR